MSIFFVRLGHRLFAQQFELDAHFREHIALPRRARLVGDGRAQHAAGQEWLQMRGHEVWTLAVAGIGHQFGQRARDIGIADDAPLHFRQLIECPIKSTLIW